MTQTEVAMIYGFTLSAAARALGVSNKTVLAWTKAGLLRPERAASGWRYFDPEEVRRLAESRAMKFK